LWSGRPLGVVLRPLVGARSGLAERPLDVARADDARWLQACIWPGETDRLRRLDLAIKTSLAGRERGESVEVLRRDAIAAPAFVRALIARAPENALTIVYQTMMSGYLDAQTRAAFEDGLHQLVVTSPPGSVLWVDLEVKGPATSPRPAELVAHARSGDRQVDLLLGTTGYHPVEVSVREEAVRELKSILNPAA
jgi:hypothetical protein